MSFSPESLQTNNAPNERNPDTMILALDIETTTNPEAVARLPEPTAKRNLKDPAKIAADIADKRAAQTENAALDALTGRICCVGMFGDAGDGQETGTIVMPDALTDEAERGAICTIMQVLGGDNTRIVTWNGIGFDLPFIYKRAIILGVNPGEFGAPPLSAWTKRYNTDRHYDLMQVWGGWNSQGFEKLDLVASMVLGERKAEIDVTTFAALMETAEGRNNIAEYCLKDTQLTWNLYKRMDGCLFA